MDIAILNTNFEVVSYVDAYTSFIWVDRYQECGDFELYLPMSSDLLGTLRKGYYLQIASSDRTMIIEDHVIKREVTNDPESSAFLTVTGRSLESILDRRIIWPQIRVTGNVQNAIEKLLNSCIIDPRNSDGAVDKSRQIPNFIFKTNPDPVLANIKVDMQYTGDNLYDAIMDICTETSLGFSIKLENGNFVFQCYAGKDRSYFQTENPYIIFSPEFDNLLDSKFLNTSSSEKTHVYVAGEGEGADRIAIDFGSGEGLNRKELYVDARDLRTTLDDGTPITPEEYFNMLVSRGVSNLIDNAAITSFEGEADTTANIEYKKDYFIGDIVQIEDGYGDSSLSRIIEIVISDDDTGFYIYPTFGNQVTIPKTK